MNNTVEKIIVDVFFDEKTNESSDKMYTLSDKKMERIAELIVQECINKIETYHIPDGNSAAGKMACELTHDALKEITNDIKEHFGVNK